MFLVVGGSAGGLEVLIKIVGALPAELPGYVLVTVHVADGAESRLPQIADQVADEQQQAATGLLNSRSPYGHSSHRALLGLAETAQPARVKERTQSIVARAG
jgi:hypothetical protein